MKPYFWIIFSIFTAVSAWAQSVDSISKQADICHELSESYVCFFSPDRSAKFKYDQSIAVIVPKNLSSSAHVNLYLQGFRGVCESESAGPLDLVRSYALDKTYKNSVTVFPLSIGKCQTYHDLLIPEFSNFLSWLGDIIDLREKSWRVLGHSGAGAVISKILYQNPQFASVVDEVVFLDAAYRMDVYVSFWKKIFSVNPNMKVRSTFIRDSRPHSGSVIFSNHFPENVRAEVSKSSGHCQVPQKDLK